MYCVQNKYVRALQRGRFFIVTRRTDLYDRNRKSNYALVYILKYALDAKCEVIFVKSNIEIFLTFAIRTQFYLYIYLKFGTHIRSIVVKNIMLQPLMITLFRVQYTWTPAKNKERASYISPCGVGKIQNF